MTYYINYSPVVDYATLAILLLFFALFKSTFYSHEKKDLWMRLGISGVFVGTFLNVWYMTVFKYGGIEFKWLIYVLRDLANITLISCVAIFGRYLSEMFEYSEKVKKHIVVMDIIVIVIYSILTITSPLTHFGFYFVNNEAVQGSFFLDPFAIFYIIMVLSLFVQLIRYRKSIMIRPYLAIIFCFVLVEGIMVGEAIAKSSTFVCFTYVMPVIMLFALFHSNSYDKRNGTLDSNAFNEYLKELNKNKKDYRIISFTFNSKSNLDHTLGSLYKDMNHFYDNYFKNYTFRLSESRFVLVYHPFDDQEKEKKALLEFKKKVMDLYKIHNLEFKSALIDSNYILNNSINYVSYLSFIEKRIPINSFYKATNTDLNNYINNLNVIEALKDIVSKSDLNDPRVLVYAQPICDVKSNCITTAESLMRLKIDDTIIYPDVFIPLAEENQCIHTLSLIILNKVCKNLNELNKNGYKIDRISVNFSTKELLADNFASEVEKIIKSNKIPFEKIGFEITESQEVDDFNLILDSVNKIKNLGIKIYLDDFGTGYSNFDRIMKLPIDIIKFDKTLVDNSMADKKFKKMTENFAKTYADLGYKILFEGIETEKEYNMCVKEMNAMYLQGYYYSKPIPIENLINFLNKK